MVRYLQGLIALAVLGAAVWALARFAAEPSPGASWSEASPPTAANAAASQPPSQTVVARREASVLPPLKFKTSKKRSVRVDGVVPPPVPQP